MQPSEFTQSTLSVNKEFSNKRTKLKITVPVMRETVQVRYFLNVHNVLSTHCPLIPLYHSNLQKDKICAKTSFTNFSDPWF
jgi:hypothetical protein